MGVEYSEHLEWLDGRCSASCRIFKFGNSEMAFRDDSQDLRAITF